jgi:pimeloyl-ACP methyl ester carboxylesterase
MPVFRFEDRRIAYSEFGAGSRTVVLIHGLLLSKRMHEPLAKALAARGNHVVTIDLLGHGHSDRPAESWLYSVPIFAEQVVGLLDHLELDEAVILGTSLGANTTLEVCRLAPERVRGMVVEMPVLDHALIASVVAFTPLMLALTFGEPLGRLAAAAARAVPESAMPFWGNVLLDTVRQEPKPSSAVMQGLFSGRVAPNAPQRRGLEAPTLVIGHRRDPIHPLSDAGMLVDDCATRASSRPARSSSCASRRSG